MELRTLKYFKRVAEELNITAAADSLHLSQPTLSRQIAQLESELGCQLFVRGSRNLELTDQGVLLYSYATQIIELASKATEEVGTPASTISGVVHIGAGETPAFSLLAQAMTDVRKSYPKITFDIHDGTSADLMDRFVRGAFDFLLECDARPHLELNSLLLPLEDTWGIFCRRDDPIASRDAITAGDLRGKPVIISSQASNHVIAKWAGKALDDMDVVATYNLITNSAYLVKEGLGYLIGYKRLVPEDGDICFRSLSPALTAKHQLLWRKTPLTKPAEVFLKALQSRV